MRIDTILDLKNYLIFGLLINITSCSFDEAGDLSIDPWFWRTIIIIIIILIISGIIGAKQENIVKESLKEDGLNISDFKKCGTYVGGHPSLDKTIEGAVIRKAENQLKIYEFANTTSLPIFKASIPIARIGNIQVEDASSIEKKITLGRLLLVGIFALAWKKKKKNEIAFVTIQWKDKFEHQTIFSFEGREAMQKANTARNNLIRMCK